MNRQQKRNKQREFDKAKNEIAKLSSQAKNIIERYAKLEAEKKLEQYKKMIDNVVFNAMRCNRVGEKRAYRIMEQANKSMLEEIEVKAVS